MIYRRYIKEFLSRSFALVLAILLVPFFLFICLGLIITQGKSIFFAQKRSGKNLQNFMLLKFRTLHHDNFQDLGLENRRYTYFGKILRTTGIDELPQLINIIKGEMAFIGPRAMPIEYENCYSQQHIERFGVKPGITGWAQVHGRNDTSWGKRFELDRWYVHHANLMIDMKIVWMTIRQFFIQGREEIKMDVFNGTNLV